MRYPVNNFKTEWNLTAGYGFGTKTDYGYHEGVDINDNGAGNSDLGKEIFAISNGELVYWHGAKHPTTGFGYHSVYKIEGSFGKRWVHQAHCMPDITPAPKAVTENERIARAGNSGTTWAHIHFAIFKVDPITLRNGIDTIAKTLGELNSWWEDPIKFIESILQAEKPTPSNQQVIIDQLRIKRDLYWNFMTALGNTLDIQINDNDLPNSLRQMVNKIQTLKSYNPEIPLADLRRIKEIANKY